MGNQPQRVNQGAVIAPKKSLNDVSNQFDAARNGNLLWFESNSFTLDKKDSQGRTSLYIAARGGHYDLTQYLVLKGADMNIVESHKSTPLHAAAYYGYGKIVQFLVGMGCNRTIKNMYGRTAAQEAKTHKIRQLILYPKRGNTQRFTLNKYNMPSFTTDPQCLVGCHWIIGLSKIRYTHVNWVENRILIVNELKRAGKNTEKFGIELAKIYKTATSQEWANKLVEFYTMESPLYKIVNSDICGVNKLTKYKYYSIGLWCALFNRFDNKDWTKVCYRSATLSNENIQLFKKHTRIKNHSYSGILQLPGFISCSKSKQVCLSWGGNVLFVILPPYTHDLGGISGGDYGGHHPKDISHLSVLPHEQEVIFPLHNQFVYMGVKQVQYPSSNTKWEITLQISSYGA